MPHTKPILTVLILILALLVILVTALWLWPDQMPNTVKANPDLSPPISFPTTGGQELKPRFGKREEEE